MDQYLSNALLILVAGMITVMLVLWLVVIVGNLLIRLTNRFSPVPEQPVIAKSAYGSISSGTVAAIVAAVETVTGGRGKVSKIEKE